MKTKIYPIVTMAAITMAMLFNFSPLHAQVGEIVPVGSWREGPCLTVAVEEDIAFYGKGSIIEIVDLSDPENPVKLSNYDSPSFIEDIVVEGNIAYIGNSGLGMTVLDISDLSNPQQIGFIDIHGFYPRLLADGDLMYYHTNSYEDFSIIDISTPSDPTLISTVKVGGKGGMVKKDNFVFVAAAHSGLIVLDVTTPENPIQIANNEEFYAYDLSLEGELLYLCSGNEGVKIIDISSPSDPQIIGSIEVPSSWYVTNCMVKENMAYLSLGGRFMIFDVSDTQNPIEMADLLNTLEDCTQATLMGNNLLIADAHKGVKIIDVSDLENPVSIGSLEAAGLSFGIDVKDNIALVANGFDGIRSFDISDPENPLLLDQYDTEELTYQVKISGNYAYVANRRDGMLILDISDPQIIREVAQHSTSGSVFSLKISGNTAYLAVDGDGLGIVDISDPENPVDIGFINLEGRIFSVDVQGDIACLSKLNNGISIIDISDLSQPEEIGYLTDMGSIESVTIHGNYVYAGLSSSLVKIVDISDPTDPVVVSEYRTSRAYHILVKEQSIYVSAGYRGLFIIDISDPDLPQEMAYYDTDGEVYDISLDDNYIYVADYNTGMKIFSYDETSSVEEKVPSISIDRLNPNPFYDLIHISFTLTKSEDVSISIVDMNGQLIQLLSAGKMMAGDHLSSWDGTDLSGQKVPTGYYLVEIAGEKERWVQPIIFIHH